MIHVLMAAMLAAACPVSPIENPLPEIIGPMAGQQPAWLIDGSSGHWAPADTRVKTLWILSKKASGRLLIEGRRLDGNGIAQFQDGGVTGEPKDRLEIDDPWRRAWASNATPEARRAYAWVPNYVIYPSPGCWQFTVHVGTAETQITIEIK